MTGNRTVKVASAVSTASSVDYSIDMVAVSKKFKRATIKKAGYTTIKSAILGLFIGGEKKQIAYTQAINNFTARIPKGASLGIIGKNGSGKSTLLKLITGIYRANSGTITVNGRISALIELGAGFHPDFTGRENLYLGGIMHGLKREEIDSRFNEIVQFAELENVIDDPVRTYSSGMYMRLGFSLAIHTDPDILIIDEVLAVGDAGFVNKCKEKIEELRTASNKIDHRANMNWFESFIQWWLYRVLTRQDPNDGMKKILSKYLFLKSFIEWSLHDQKSDTFKFYQFET